MILFCLSYHNANWRVKSKHRQEKRKLIKGQKSKGEPRHKWVKKKKKKAKRRLQDAIALIVPGSTHRKARKKKRNCAYLFVRNKRFWELSNVLT